MAVRYSTCALRPRTARLDVARRLTNAVALWMIVALSLALAPPASASPPTAPGSLGANSVSSTQVTLSWTASSDDASITAYVIQRCQGAGCTSLAQVASIPSGTAYTDSGLSAGTVYQYQVYSMDSDGASSQPSNVASATTLATSVASSVNYAYDALGRVVQATVPALNIVENYTYDAGGNLLSVTPSPLSTLSVSTVSSAQGAPGGTLTIFGSGFSATPSQNTVQINGTAATIISATNTQLVVAIPSGATSGLITVTTGSSTATTAGSFTVAAATGAPTLSGVPAIAAPGSTIIITGSGFQTDVADDTVLINGTEASVVSATPTVLTVAVPQLSPNAVDGPEVAGPITVTTPFGSAVSATSLVVTALATSGTIGNVTVNGPAVTVATSTNTSYYTELFNGTAGQNLIVNLSGQFPQSASVTVFAPDGTTLATGKFTASGSLQVPALPKTATYVAQVYSGNTARTLSLSISGPLTGSLSLDGSPVSVTTTVSGQAAALTFNGTQNATVSLSLTGVTFSSGTVEILNPDGSVLTSSTLSTSGVALLPQLPATGAYTVVVVPSPTATGSFTAALSTAVPALVANQGPVNLTFTNTTPQRLLFYGTAGEYVSLAGLMTSGSGLNLAATVTRPDGTWLTSAGWSLSNSKPAQVISLGPLTETGSYSVVLQENSSSTGTLAVTLATPATGTASLGNTTTTTVTQLGQGVAESFAGTAGQFVSVAFVTSGQGSSISNASIQLLDPTGAPVSGGVFTGSCSGAVCSGSGVTSVGPLSSSGIFTALLQQTTGSTYGPGTGTVSVTVSQAAQGTVSVGAPGNVAVQIGQDAAVTFAASAGQYLSIGVWAEAASLTVTSGSIVVLDPYGIPVGQAGFYGGTGSDGSSSGSGVVNVGPLSLTGTYTVVLEQATGSLGPQAATINFAPEYAVAGTLTPGTPSTISLAAGQGFAQSVSATAGQYLSVQLTSQGAIYALTSGTLSVLAPSGTVLATAPVSGQCTSSPCQGAANLNVGPLPAAGTYTLLFQQVVNPSLSPGAASLATSPVVTVEAPLTGTLTVGTSVSVSPVNAQAVQETFSGTAGQYLTATVSETNGSIQGATVSILTPSGAVLSTANLAANSATPNSCNGTATMSVGPLPATGNYTLLVQQTPQAYGFGSGPLNLQINVNVPGSGTSLNFSTTAPGQTVQFAYLAAAAQTFDLTFTNLTYAPSSQNTFSVQIVDPTGANVLSNNNNSCGGSYCNLSVPGSTKTGTYTVTATPGSSATFSGTAAVTTGALGTLAIGTPVNLSLATGQGASLAFDTTAGQTLSLNVSSVTTTPANADYTFAVYNPAGQYVSSAYVAGGTTLNLPNLAGGTYTFVVTPGNPPASSTMQVTLVQGAAGTLPLNGNSLSVSTTEPGEYAYVSFPAVFRQSYSLAISGLSTTPSASDLKVVQPYATSSAFMQGTDCAPPGCVKHFPQSPLSGNVTATIEPSPVTTMNFSATVSPDVTATLSPGVPLNLSLGETGQAAMLMFNVPGPGAQSPTLNISNFAPNPSATSYSVAIYNLDQTFTNFNGMTLSQNSPGGTLNMPNLQPGAYLVVITPFGPAVASMQVTLEPNATAILPATGSTTTLSTSTPGEYGYISLTGTAGQPLTIALTNLVLTPSSSSNLSLVLVGPNGQIVTSAKCDPTAHGCEFSVADLPETGTYTLQIEPPSTSAMSFAATVPAVVTGTLAAGMPENIQWTTAGQSAILGFTLSAQQTVALNLGSVSVTPASTSINCFLYDSSGTLVTGGSVTTPSTFNVQNLAAGSYTVALVPTSPVTGNLQITLQPGIGATLPVDGTSTNISSSDPGQYAYLSFAGTAGQSLSVALTNITVSPSSSSLNVLIDGPNGSQYTSISCSTSGTGCELHLKNLTTTGTYTIIAEPNYQSMSFTVSLSLDLTGTLTLGTPFSVNLGSTGQSATLSFAQSVTQTMAVNLGSIAVTPASTALSVTVYNSSGNQILNPVSSTTGATLNLTNLAAGNYTVVVTPAYPVTGTWQVTVATDVSATLATDGSSTGFDTSVPGQFGYFTFAGTVGQSLSIAFTNISLSPNSSFPYIPIYGPLGSYYTTVSCSTPASGCELHLRSLTSSGTYTIYVEPSYQTVGFTMTLSSDVSGSLTSATPLTVSLAATGQSATVTFVATASENIALTLSSISVTPSTPINVYVYNSGGSQITSASTTSGETVNLTNLAAGTYSVVLIPTVPVTGSLQVSYQ